MSFAMCVPDGLFIILTLLLVVIGCACLAAVLAVAFYTTIGLAKWAAARHNRLAANAR